MPELAALDWMLLAVLAISMLYGLWHGLVREFFSLAGWIAAFFFAQGLASAVGQWLPMQGSSPLLRTAAGFAVVLVGVLIVSTLLGWIVSKLLAAVGLGPLDRLLGGVFGLLRGVVLLLALTLLVGLTPLRDHPLWQQSVGAQHLRAGLQWLTPFWPEGLGKGFI